MNYFFLLSVCLEISYDIWIYDFSKLIVIDLTTQISTWETENKIIINAKYNEFVRIMP